MPVQRDTAHRRLPWSPGEAFAYDKTVTPWITEERVILRGLVMLGLLQLCTSVIGGAYADEIKIVKIGI